MSCNFDVKSLPFIALTIALISGFLGIIDWFRPATPFLSAMAIVFLILAIGAAGVHRLQNWR